MPRGQWSTQTHDLWGRCQNKDNKVRRKKCTNKHVCTVTSFPRFHFVTCLFNTFPEPPLIFEESPFSTARKFSGVTSCRETPVKVYFYHQHLLQCPTKHWLGSSDLFALLYKYLSWKTHIPSVVFRNSLIYVCAIRPVDYYPGGGVSGNKNILIYRRKWMDMTTAGMTRISGDRAGNQEINGKFQV